MDSSIFQEVHFLNDIGIINESSFIKGFLTKIKDFIIKVFTNLIKKIKEFINKLIYKNKQRININIINNFLKSTNRSITITGGYSEKVIKSTIYESITKPIPEMLEIVNKFGNDIVYYMALVYRGVYSDYKKYDFDVDFNSIIGKIYGLYPDFIDKNNISTSIKKQMSSTFVLRNDEIKSYVSYNINETVNKLKELCNSLKDIKNAAIKNIDMMNNNIEDRINSSSLKPNKDNLKQIEINFNNYKKLYDLLILYSSETTKVMIELSSNVISLQQAIINLAKNNIGNDINEFSLNLKEE